MQTSLNWINSYLDIPTTPDEVETVLTAAGFEVDDVQDNGNDTLFDIEVTSNRTDCLSHIGMAREVAAASQRKLSTPFVNDTSSENPPSITDLTNVTNDAPDVCPTYIARVIQGLKVAPSPDWLVERIESIGLRPINNVVDITNFVLHETGLPLHAFDISKLDGQRIIIRHAQDGETFSAIDNTTHKLKPTMLVIADASKPVAVAGVMGGLDSQVSDTTTDILLEAARFDPLSVRATSRALKLSSDSSYRFERKVDPAGSEAASKRAVQLILDLAGGTLAQGAITVGQPAPSPSHLTMRISRCNGLLGIEISSDKILDIFSNLQLSPTLDGDNITCTIPTFRLDLTREIDLIEEVARMNGMDDEQLPVQEKMSLIVKRPQPKILARKTINHILTSHGFFETITFSNLPLKHAKLFVGDLEIVELNKEQKKSDPALRPSLLPSLLETRKGNQDAGNHNVRLFEIAHIFGKRDGQYVEKTHLGLLIDAPNANDALRTTLGIINELLQAMGLHQNITFNYPDTSAWAQPAGEILSSDQQTLGTYGLATPDIQKQFDLQTPIVLAQLDYTQLIANYPPQATVKPLPKFPTIERDLSVVVDETTPWVAVQKAIDSAQTQLLENVVFVTVYRGKQVGKGKKSVTFRMCFRHPDRTLQHEEVDPQVENVVNQLKTQLNGEIRG